MGFCYDINKKLFSKKKKKKNKNKKLEMSLLFWFPSGQESRASSWTRQRKSKGIGW
jgi:hypothetical protein